MELGRTRSIKTFSNLKPVDMQPTVNYYALPGLPRLPREYSPEDAMQLVLNHYKLTWNEISKPCRKPVVVRARCFIWLLLKKRLTYMQLIALTGGVTHHTSILHGILSLEADIKYDLDLKALHYKFTCKLNGVRFDDLLKTEIE